MSSKTLIVTAVALAAGVLAFVAAAGSPQDSFLAGGAPRPQDEGSAQQVRVVVVSQDENSTEDFDQQDEQLKAQSEELQKKAQELSKQAKELAKQQAKKQAALRNQVYVISGRPRVGLVLRTEKDASTDASGAYVEAVTPGGPAEEAGIKAGDIITKFNGESLTGKNPDVDEDESAPAFRLMGMVGKLKAGDKVTLNYLRGKEAKTATVTLRKLDEHDYAYRFHVTAEPPDAPDAPEAPELSEIPEMPDMDIEIPDFNSWSFMGHGLGWLDMEMVPMNPDLGEYFGTSDGILVVHAPDDSPLKIKAGDVILKVGDRTPKTPSQVMRILRSYEPGENVNLEVYRKRAKSTLSFKVPERSKAEWHEHMRAPVTVPPVPPTAVAPRATAPATPAPTAAPAPPAPPRPAAGTGASPTA